MPEDILQIGTPPTAPTSTPSIGGNKSPSQTFGGMLQKEEPEKEEAIPGTASAVEEDEQETPQRWNVLGLDYPNEVKVPSKEASLIEKGVRKGKVSLEEKKRRREAFGYDAAIDYYSGNEMGFKPKETTRNVVNFLIGDDLAVLGFEWNKENLSWTMDNMKQTWAEEPLWKNTLRVGSLALNFVPLGAAINKSMKFGKLGKLLPAKSFRYIDPVDGANSFRWFERFNTIDDERRFLSSVGKVTDDASEVAIKEARAIVEAEQRANKLQAIERAVGEGQQQFQWAGEFLPISNVDKMKVAFHRRFANSYWAASNSTSRAFYGKFFSSLDNFYKSENFGRFFSEVPDNVLSGDWATSIHKYMQTADARHIAGIGDDAHRYLDDLKNAYTKHQQDWFDLGAIDADQLADIPRHIPTQRPGTTQPNLYETTISVVQDSATKQVRAKPRIGKLPRLGAETLKHRKARTVDEILAKIDSGEIISDVEQHMLPNLMLDRTLMHNFKFMRDAIRDMPGLAVTADDMAKASKSAKAAYLDLEGFAWNGKETLRRILKKHAPEKLGANGDLPFVSRAVFKEWMGKAGMMDQAFAQKGLLQALVTIHKTMKTAGNIPTQLNNIIGNMIMQTWRGYNPLEATVLKSGTQFARAFRKHAKQLKAKAGDEGAKVATNLGNVDVVTEAGKKISYDIADLINDGVFVDLIEESAFQNVEGLRHLEDIYKTMNKEGLSAKAVKGMLDIKKVPGVGRTIDEMTEIYLMADMIPKAQMYVRYLAEGMSKEAAAAATSRALPMYATVGPAIQTARKAIFPWATFPAEMTRIIKNNLQDHPMRLLPWFNMVSALQATGYVAGYAEDYEATQESKQSLPQFAQTPMTVMGKGSFTDMLQAAPSGAILGGVAGTMAGMPATGAAVGAGLGVAASLLNNHDKETDTLRGAVLRWLPHTSVFLGQNAPEMMNQMTGKELVKGLSEGRPSTLFQAIMPGKDVQTTGSILPAQPLAIFEPVINMLAGKTAYGQEIKGTDAGDTMSKTMAGLIGFMAPPVIQTYGFRQTAPGEPLPHGALFGAAAGAAAGGAAGGGLPGILAGAAGGALLGGTANVSRIGEDIGSQINPRTMREKDTFADFILNNIGALKSYAATPEQRAANLKNNEQQIQGQRSAIKKQAAYYMVNHREEKAVHYLHMAHTTFERQYPLDPKLAETKFAEWMEDFVDTVGESPLWGGLSKEEMKSEIVRTRNKLGNMRSQALREWMGALRAAKRNR